MSIELKGAMGYEWQHCTEQTIKLMADSGAKVIKPIIYTDDYNNDIASWINPSVHYQAKSKQIRDWCTKYGLKLWLCFDGRVYGDWTTKNSVCTSDSLKADWIAECGKVIAGLKPDVVTPMNEPSDLGQVPQYRQFCLDCMAAWKAIKSDLVFVLDSMPFWNFTEFMKNPIQGVVYETHYGYMYNGLKPPDWSTAQIAYWNGDLVNAKILLYQELDYALLIDHFH